MGANNPLAMTKQRLCNQVRPSNGFTLIELLIAIAIAGTLLMVALPSYQNSVLKGKRSDAFAAVSAVQLAQERWRANNSTYTTSLDDLKVTAPSLYTLTITTPTSATAPVISPSTGYVVTVEGIGAQAADKQCQKMGVKLAAGNLSYAGCSNCALTDLVYAASNACWAR
jgi:type IV pilus assembly protein PilE